MSGQSQIALEIEGLTAGYKGQVVLEHFDLVLQRGDRVALVGPNGCGKSTLLRALTGVIPCKSGHIRFRGMYLEHLPTEDVIRCGIGYLKDRGNVFAGLTVNDNLRLACLDGDREYGRRRDVVLGLMPMLVKLTSVRAGLLSGGQRQGLALAMVLMRDVELLLLDEPVCGLSPGAAEVLLTALHALCDAQNVTYILVEHRLRAVAQWANRAILMTKGRIAEDTRDTSILTDRARLERHYLL
jgi:ABC-type branched-subunit amino acid transport system ATPase component